MAIMLNAIILVGRREAEGGVDHGLSPLAFMNSCTALYEGRWCFQSLYNKLHPPNAMLELVWACRGRSCTAASWSVCIVHFLVNTGDGVGVRKYYFSTAVWKKCHITTETNIFMIAVKITCSLWSIHVHRLTLIWVLLAGNCLIMWVALQMNMASM